VRAEALLERQASINPARVAVVCGGVRYSYGEIDAASGRLADELRKGGVASGARVGIRLENSADAIVALFAVLKAGGVFLRHQFP
jgi:acyl-CoA synthetase (AMP-forming)/AMP-acid ligase II